MATPSVRSGSQTGLSATSPRDRSLKVAAVTAAARSALNAGVSASPGASLGTVVTSLDFNNFYLHQADQKLKAKDLEDAHGYYQAALETFNAFEKTPDADFIELSNIPAACYIGIAKTCDPSEKAKNIELAREALDDAYNNRSKWNGLDLEKTSLLYNGLKINLENYIPLIIEDNSRYSEIYEMIVECKKDIPPLYAATYALRKGHELFKQDNFTEAEKWYTEATNLSENLEIVEYHAIMASCFIGFAATTQQYDADGKCDNNLYLFAYKEIVCLFTEIKKQPSENAYEHILHLSAELMKLIPNTQPKFLPSLRLIIDDCQKELEVLKKPAPDNQAQPSGSGRVPRQPQSYFTIFAAFVLGGLAALAGVALYGRVIAKID